MKYKLAAVGGTFDFLHKGHKVFLNQAFAIADKVVIGLTTDEYIAKYKSSFAAPFLKRKQYLEDYLKKNNFDNRCEIISIYDPYGPSITDQYPIDVLLVSPETQETGIEINDLRQRKGLSALDIVVVHLITNKSLVISSSYVRAEVMAEDGKLRIPFAWLKETFILPKENRYLFQKPFGKLTKSDEIDFEKIHQNNTVTVGDVTTKMFNDRGVYPRLAVIDFIVERKKRFHSLSELGFFDNVKIYKAVNPSGTIAPDSWNTLLTIAQTITKNETKVLEIQGEEDLLVLPLVIVLPVGFTIYYGQPHQGLVELKVTKENKKQAYFLMGLLKGTTRGY